MKKIFLDTNFVIDYLLRDEYKEGAQSFLYEGSKRKIIFCISFLSVANFAYIARKLPKADLYRSLSAICDLFEIIPNTEKQIESAIELNSTDFEDALQYQAALDSECECIITRNQRDFTFSQIPVLSASDYASIYFN